MNPLVQTVLEKLLRDTGYDLSPEVRGGWLMGASSGAKVRVFLKQDELNQPVTYALTESWLAKEFNLQTLAKPEDAPDDAVFFGQGAASNEVYEILKRAFQLSRALPSSPLELFRARTSNMPQTTEAEVETVRRVGQDIFRGALLDYWDNQCAATGFDIPELLRASHMKPWRDATNEERLSPYNGLLLAPHLDLLFDKGYISFTEEGSLLVSGRLKPEQLALLGVSSANVRIEHLDLQHLPFLDWHRRHVFK